MLAVKEKESNESNESNEFVAWVEESVVREDKLIGRD